MRVRAVRCLLALVLLWGPAARALPPGRQVCEVPLAARASPRALPERVQQALDALVRAELSRRPHVGLAAGVLHGGARWVQAYGMRDLERGVPVTPRTTWRMASVTKSFTAVAVLQLVEQGRLSLDADIHTLVPSFPEKRWPVTVRQLLGHLGGVQHYDRKRGPGFDTGPLDTAGAVALVAERPLVAEPGTRFVYSTWAYNLLGAAIEEASGLDYGTYLQRHVFAPAGMEQAALDARETRGPQHAAGYRLRGGRPVPSRQVDVSGRFAGGGTRASVEDMLAFGGALLEGRLLSPHSWALMQQPMRTRDGRRTDYGMGVASYTHGGHRVVGHLGAQPETSTLLLLLPEERVVIALASNLEGQAEVLRQLAYRLVRPLAAP